MPRANRVFLPGYVWHITHRCHQREFLLKFARDRQRWLWWLFQARKRFGLCVLNYIVTSNHVHLLVRDRGADEIPKSMQLIAGRTAQEYNQRKGRRGAYWEDRYHATAVDTNGYLARCMVYIDMNMVRTGVVEHPVQWWASGFREIQHPPARYRIIDQSALLELFSVQDMNTFQKAHNQWVTQALRSNSNVRDSRWTQALAVGSECFVTRFQSELSIGGSHREVNPDGDGYRLGEPPKSYNSDFGGKMVALRAENSIFIDEIL